MEKMKENKKLKRIQGFEGKTEVEREDKELK
jgi:hypothetical protein